MNAPLRNDAAQLLKIAQLIDDRPAERVFQGRPPAIFTDEKVFEAELRQHFRSDPGISSALNPRSQSPTIFVTTHIGPPSDPGDAQRRWQHRRVFSTPAVTPRPPSSAPSSRAAQKFHVCRYHGWAYDSGGPQHLGNGGGRAGNTPPSFSNENHDPDPPGAARLPIAASCSRGPVGRDVPPAGRVFWATHPRVLRPHPRPERQRRGRAGARR